MNDVLDKVLNDIEKAELASFANNKTMFEAVRKVLLAGLYFNGTLQPGEPALPTLNFALALVAGADAPAYTDEQLGANLRAQGEGIRLMQSAFNRLENFGKTGKKSTASKNPAR